MMLEIRNVRKSFEGQTVLDGIDLDVEKGDVVAILGPSGSGKTTFLRCLNFLERADAGSMIFDGRKTDLHTADRKEITAIRRKTAFVFQNYNLFLNQNVLKNVTLGLTSGSGMKAAEAKERAVAALEKVGMSGKLDSYPSQLSGGQQQRVAIARALCKNPDLLLCDEPTGALDSASGIQVLEAICRFRKQYGKTVVLITHNSDIAKIGDRVFRFRDGRLTDTEVNAHPLLPGGIRW